MLIYMRTTLVLDNALFKRAKQQAASLGTTFSDLVSQALRQALTKPAAPATRFEMITFGNARRRVHHEPADFSEAIEADDRQSLGR